MRVTPEPVIPPEIVTAPIEDVNRDEVLEGAPVTSITADDPRIRSSPKEAFLVFKLN